MTVRLDFKASASASQGKAGSKLQAAKTPWEPPGLGTLVSDVVVLEVDADDGAIGVQGICECLSGEPQGRNCKDVGDRPVGLQCICECLPAQTPGPGSLSPAWFLPKLR